jgi:hypothetical protein
MADRNSIIEKIKALLAKTTANGATEAEMMSALDKASAMMDAYDITDADVQVAKNEAAMQHADPPDLKDPHNISGSATALANSAACRFTARAAKLVSSASGCRMMLSLPFGCSTRSPTSYSPNCTRI